MDIKLQPDAIVPPPTSTEGLIVSPDTLRGNRLPPRQSRTKKWPILDASGPPKIDMGNWRLEARGLVERPRSWTWKEFHELPRIQVFADFHCVTRWSRLGNLWEGVRTSAIVNEIKVLPAARYVLVHGYDGGWSTNMPLDAFLSEDALFADRHDGEPLSLEHGGPLRLIIPRLYAWKSAKWIRAVEFVSRDEAGFWEQAGYHMKGDPWLEQRYR